MHAGCAQVTTAFRVLLNDALLLLTNKPAGLLSVPSTIIGTPCASSAAISARRALPLPVATSSYFSSVPEAGADFPDELLSTHHVVHRLDEATSGLLAFATSRASASILWRAFATRRVYKLYEAVLDTRATPASSPLLLRDSGIIDFPLGRRVGVPLLHTGGEGARSALGGPLELKSAISRWSVIERGDGAVRVLFEPLTGRTHQLRLHATLYLRAPIIGDALYGSDDLARAPFSHFLAQRLHNIKEDPASVAEHEAVLSEARARLASVENSKPPSLASCAALGRGGAVDRMLLHARELALPRDVCTRQMRVSRKNLEEPRAALATPKLWTHEHSVVYDADGSGFRIITEASGDGERRVRFVLSAPF